MLQPQLIEVEAPGRREPRMRRWVDIMARHGGGHVFTYPATFFQWLERKVIYIDDYAYAGTDLQNDPDMILPPGSRWDVDLGKKKSILCYFEFYDVFGIFYKCMYTDNGSKCLLQI